MCGIIGSISNQELSFRDGLNVINHRGPDSEGFFEYETVKLGHKRLSIIDLEGSSGQPYIIKDNVIIFNGEIYNYKELKQQLLIEGVEFQTQGDTEVLLKWLIHKGIEGVKYLEGMFSFAWLKTSTGKLYLCRDAIGIKPLYVYKTEEYIIFSSEIKSIFACLPKSKQIDNDCLAEYLLNGFIYEPETGFKNIRKIEPGSYELYNLSGKLLEKQNYWSLVSIEKQKASQKDISEEIKRSIKTHLVSDVPVGLFFSGGVDSSIILTQTKKTILPVTIKSEQDDYRDAGMSSDYEYAKKVSSLLNIDIDEVELKNTSISNHDFLKMVEEVAIGNEELMADFTFQSSKTLSKKVKEKGLTVMLSGLGADEIFGGYPRYKLIKYNDFFQILKPFVFLFQKNKWFSKKIERFKSYFKENEFSLKYASLLGYFSKSEVELLLKNDSGILKYQNKINILLKRVSNYSNVKKAMYLDFYGFLAHNFSVADKSSMLSSIELRVPLATKKLYELSWPMEENDLIKYNKLKIPLRNFLLDYLPKEIIDRKKAGFNAPLDKYINDLGDEKILSVYNTNGLFKIIDENTVKNIITQHYSLKSNNTYKLYQLLHLSFWFKNYS